MCSNICRVDDGLHVRVGINEFFHLAVKTLSVCTSPPTVQVMTVIVFVRSIPFTTSYWLFLQTASEFCASDRIGIICRPAGVSVVNIVLLSADEAEARWLRPEEPGRARVGKAQCREGPPLCQLHYVPLRHHVK